MHRIIDFQLDYVVTAMVNLFSLGIIKQTELTLYI